MYNKNGLFLINNRQITTGRDLYYAGTDIITFSNGTKNGSNAVYTYYSSSTTSFATGLECQTRLFMSGFANSSVSTAKPGSSYGYVTSFILGYRASAFTEETYDYPSSVTGVSSNVAVTSGRVTITAINNGNSNATVNEIAVGISGGTSTNSATSGGIVIAGFHFPDITIAPGESYTFTIMHKNA